MSLFLQKTLQFGTNVRHYDGYFVNHPFVFIYFSGPSFIFDIFRGLASHPDILHAAFGSLRTAAPVIFGREFHWRLSGVGIHHTHSSLK
jgi:hypothetical protein